MTTTTLEDQADRAASSGQFAAARHLLDQAVALDEANLPLRMKLSAMCKASGDLQGALAAIEGALALSPIDLPALLARAVILDRLGHPDAGQAYGQALAQIPAGQTVPREWQAAVAHARKRSLEYGRSLAKYLTDHIPAGLTPAEQSRAKQFVANRCGFGERPETTEFEFPDLPRIEFHDPVQFAGLGALEQATEAIRGEFEALIAAEAAEMVPYVQYPDRVPLRQWKELNNNLQWTAIHLLQNGWPVDINARHCPQTMAAIARMDQPRVAGASPVAMFSLLAPHTRIPAHRGVTNTRLVCHLPLIVPPHCGFRVGNTTREWRVGEAFVFDDTIEHEAWNDSDELRVVLIIDLWPPALGPGDRRTVAAIVGASNANFVAANKPG